MIKNTLKWLIVIVISLVLISCTSNEEPETAFSGDLGPTVQIHGVTYFLSSVQPYYADGGEYTFKEPYEVIKVEEYIDDRNILNKTSGIWSNFLEVGTEIYVKEESNQKRYFIKDEDASETLKKEVYFILEKMSAITP